jgi:hypothetical protein
LKRHISHHTFLALAIVGGVCITLLLGGDPSGRSMSSITELFTGGLLLPRIVLESGQWNGALFDIVVTVPEESIHLQNGQPLLVTVELTNFGRPGETNVTLTYLIAGDNGRLALIEHEKRVVETQQSFLKTLALPGVAPGQYHLYVELLYSNASAIGTSQFRVID